MSRWLRNSALLLAIAFAPAWADDAVQVTAVRHPVDKSYRKMVQGMDLFEDMHALAPKATLRYRLYARKRGTDLHIGALYVVGDQVDMAIPVAADNSFTLRRGLPEDALVRS